jgi:NADH-quinone oxidoreductase subunit F
MSENLSHLLGRKGPEKTLFDELGQFREPGVSPSQEKILQLRKEFLVGSSTVAGSLSFYDFLQPENRGKKAYICNGSACLTAGTQENLRQNLLRFLPESEIGTLCCLGRCHENHAFQIHGQNYSGADAQNLEQLVAEKTPTKEQYHIAHLGTPILTGPIENLNSWYNQWAEFLNRNPEEALQELKSSGLRGRGGAGFSMAFKLEACRKETHEPRFLVCNADEGDPGAFSDRYLMEEQTHKLLLGMMMAGFLMEARWGIIYIRGEYPESITAVENGIAWLRQQNLIGENLFGTGFSFDFKIVKALGAYICGEETALLSSIEGQRPEVRIRPPYPTQKGLFNQPTVVNNVETLANLPYIFAFGSQAFRDIGTGKSTGTKLVSLDSHFQKPGLYEVDMGTPLVQLIQEAGGFRVPVKAMHIGGPLGGLVPTAKINDLNIDFESFSSNGFLLGHASVVCIPDTFPIIRYLQHLFQFTAHESCGKCFPCRLGSVRGAELLENAASNGEKIDTQLFQDLLETMEIGSLCALGGGLPLPMRNALQYFQDELSTYFSHKA